MEIAVELVTSTTRQTQQRSKVLTPVDTGLLRSSQVVRIVVKGRRVIGTVTALADYGLPVHDGWVRYRPIRPRRGKALRFRVGGRTVIVAAVNSPASYGGRPFMRRALFEVAAARGFRVSV